MFKLYNIIPIIGNGISPQEYNSIRDAAIYAYNQTGGANCSTMAANSIKGRLGGNWFVFCSDVSDNDFNFALTCVKGGDFFLFTLNNVKFQVLRLN